MKLEGDLREIDLIPHLLALADERFTGAIRFEEDGIIKILYFKEGDVLSASTNDRADSVDEILLRAGKVNRDHIRQALGKRKDNETLGDALLSMGFISRKELAWGRRTQIVGILRSVANWREGSYQIVHDYLPNREEGTLFHLPQIILELGVTEPDKAKVEQRIDGGLAVFHKRPEFSERYAKLALNEDADAIVEQIDGERSAAEVAAVSKLDAFAAYKLLLALEWLHMVERDKPKVSREVLAPLEGEPPALVEAAASYPVAPLLPPPASFEDGGPVEPDPPVANWTPPSESAIRATDLEEMPAETDATSPPQPGRSGRSSSWLLLLALLLVIGLGAWGGWVWWRGRAEEPASPPVRPTPRAATNAPAEPPPVQTQPAAPIPTATPVVETAPAATATARELVRRPAVDSDPARARYQEMAEAFARDGRRVPYAVQFELVCQTESVTRALAAGSAVWFVPVRYRGDACFRVFWGRYDTRDAAERGKDEIPPALRGSGPVVVRPQELLR